MSSATRSGRNLLAVAATLGTLACVALMILRIVSAVSVATPMQVITSGWEQQPLFDIWRILAGERLYIDATKIPFAIAFYNWLFYAAYALYAQAIMGAFALEDVWLPTVLRSFTIIGLLVGTAITYETFRRLADLREPADRFLGFCLAVFIFFGPLIGFWGVTVRPDIWAMVFEISAVLMFWSLRSTYPLSGIILAATCLFAAWALKQSNIVTTIAIGLYLLRAHPKSHVLLYSALLIAGYSLSFATGGRDYARSLLYTAEVAWNLDALFHIGVNFLSKSAPTLLATLAMTLAALRHHSVRRVLSENAAFRFAGTSLLIAVVIALASTAKEGAAENYYFLVSFFLALVALVGMRALRRDEEQRRSPASRSATFVSSATAVGWLALTIAVATVLMGVQGVRSVSSQHARYTEQAECLSPLPKPILTSDQYLSLPWMNPSQPSFILNYNYPIQRTSGVAFEAGGIAGLIERRYFAALALSHPDGAHDGAQLSNGYERQPALCAGLTIWLRKSY